MNLDAAPPSVEYYADDTSPPTKRLALSVTRTDPEQVELHAITRNALVEWRARVFYSGPDGDGSLTVDDNGRPFRVTTETSSAGYANEGVGSISREHFWDKSGIRMR